MRSCSCGSLNTSDQGNYPYSPNFPSVAGSDGAVEVIEVEDQVTKWTTGDRIATFFNPGKYAQDDYEPP
jgi:NADPH:quinone reductase-like Zn-dependent oxidoreductase